MLELNFHGNQHSLFFLLHPIQWLWKVFSKCTVCSHWKNKVLYFQTFEYLLKPLHVQLAFTAIHTINRATKTIFFSHPLKAMNMESTNQNIWTFSLCWVFSTKNDFQIYKLWRASCWGTPNWLKFRQSRVRRGWDPIWTHLFEQFKRKSAYLM